MSKSPLLTLYLIRHGETEWSLTGQHTGLTDLPLIDAGKKQAELLKKRLEKVKFNKVFCSPLRRAKETCAIAGLKGEMSPDLIEWDYGNYEGLTRAEILKKDPSWSLFDKGCPGGEAVQDVHRRACRFLSSLEGLEGNVAVFSSGHISRSIACCWLDFPLAFGKSLLLSPASISVLGREHLNPAIVRWNDISHLTYT